MRNRKISGGMPQSLADVEEYKKSKASFTYWCANHLKIVSKLNPVPMFFRMFPYQKFFAHALKHHLRICGLKPRQMGLSTELEAYALWWALFKPNQNVVVVTIKHEVAKQFLRHIKGMYERLPYMMRMRVTNGNSRDIGSATQIHFANGSRIVVMGSTPDAGRSEAANLLIVDEAAFQKHAETMWGAAGFTLDEKTGQAIIISTAYGMGNFFHKTWVGALAGTNGFFPVNITYDMWPGRDEKWLEGMIQQMGRKRVSQEILCNFLDSGDTVFDMGDIRAAESRMEENPPVEVRDYKNQEKCIHIYEYPQAGISYTIGADIATGRATDYTAFSVYRRCYGAQKGEPKFKEVACGMLRLDVVKAADLLMEIGYEYNGAFLAIERNGVGEGTVAAAQAAGYDNLYHHEQSIRNPETGEIAFQKLPGFVTTINIRKTMIAEMEHSLNSNEVEINNPFFNAQAYSFVYDASGTPRAAGKDGKTNVGMYEDGDAMDKVDDSIMASSIALYACRRHEYGHSYGVLPAVR